MDTQFIHLCRNGYLDEAKELYNNDVHLQHNMYLQSYTAFKLSCYNGHKKTAEWIYSLGYIGNNDDGEVFRMSCFYGHMEIAKWLYSFGNIDIHAYGEDAFKWSCYNGCKELAEWLYSLGADIHCLDDKAFEISCSVYRMEIIKWLLSIDKFNDNIVDKCLPSNLHEYAFKLGYLPISKMRPSYDEYKKKIRKEIKEENISGTVSVFEMDDLLNIIIVYL